MKWIKVGLVALTLALAAGCAALQGVTTLTPNEQEAAAVTGLQTASQLGDSLALSGKLTKAEAQSTKSQIDSIYALVAAARALPTGDAGIATDLAQAASLLTSLQSYLNTKQGT